MILFTEDTAPVVPCIMGFSNNLTLFRRVPEVVTNLCINALANGNKYSSTNNAGTGTFSLAWCKA